MYMYLPSPYLSDVSTLLEAWNVSTTPLTITGIMIQAEGRVLNF